MIHEIKCPTCGDNMEVTMDNIQSNIVQCHSCKNYHQLTDLEDALRASFKKKEETPSRPTYERESNEVTLYEKGEFSLSSVPRLHELPSKPHGSKIDLQANFSTIEMRLPVSSLGGGDVFILIFATFWLGFVAFWTFMAASAFFIMALFSIPFWWVGISMWRGIIKRLTEKQSIEISTDAIKIIRKGLLLSKEEVIPLEHINSINFKDVNMKNFSNGFANIGRANMNSSRVTKNKMELPTIQAGVKSYTFMENMLEIEQEWGIELLNRLLRKNYR